MAVQTSYMKLIRAQNAHVPAFRRVTVAKVSLADIIERGKAARKALGIREASNIVSVKIPKSEERAAVVEAVSLPPIPQVPVPPQVIIVVTQEQLDTAEDREPLIRMPTWKAIVREVAAKHRVAIVDILSARRSRELVAARYEAMYRMRHETPLSYPQIGRRLGGRDHTTVLHGVRKHTAMLEAMAN